MAYSNFNQVFQSFENLKVLIIGDVMIDAYIWGSVERISPEAPVPVVKAIKKDYRLGGAANVALNIQALGATPILCAVVGEDSTGDKVIERLKEREISNEGIIKSSARPTTVKTRVLSGHQHVVRVDEESDMLLDENESKLLLEKITSLLPLSDVIVFEDYDKGVITKEIIEKTVALAKQNDIPTVVDPKKRNFLSYKETTLFKPNLKELKDGLKIEFDKNDPKKIEFAVAELMKQLNCGGSLITLSEKGVFINLNGEKHHIPAHLREIADVSGAGDTVISIAALCMAIGLNPQLTAALSNLGGGLVCEHVGVVPIDKNDLLQEANKLNIST